MEDGEAVRASWVEYQKDTLALLEGLGRLCGECQLILYPDEGDAEHRRFEGLAREIEGLHRQIRQLELRLVVVAPMKAGKSTIINAVLGQDLLPNRNSAATSIPTEIADEPELTEPVLELTQGLRDCFREAGKAIQRALSSADDGTIDAQLSQYPHLVSLAQDLRDRGPRPLGAKIHGKDGIQDVLVYLNDVTRICADIAPASNPLPRLDPEDAPRIFVQIRRAPGEVGAKSLGRLVIVDTPGPNEASHSDLGLERIVEHQLQQSSVVLLVLDYTQLNTEAGARIRSHVDRMRERVGDANFIVAVNKVDARSKPGDMTQDQVASYVSRELQIDGFEPARHLFEMSAVFGLEASSYLHAADAGLPAEVVASHALALLRRKSPVSEEDELREELQEADEEQLKDVARRFWKKSKMEALLTGCLSELMSRAGPRVFETAFHASARIATDLKNALELRLASSGTTEASIRREVEALEQQARRVSAARAEIERRKEDAKKKLDAALQYLLEQVRLDVDRTIRRIGADDKAASAPAKEQGFLQRLFGKLNPQKGSSSHYENQLDADAAIAGLLEEVKHFLGAQLNGVRGEIKELVAAFVLDVRHIVEDELLPILEESVDRMRRSLNARLEVPGVQFDVGEISFSFRSEKKSQKVREEGFDRVTTTETRWYTLWLYDHTVEKVVYRPAVYEDRYVIDLPTLAEHAIATVGNHITAVRQSLDAYLSESVASRIDRFVSRVMGDLDSYQANLAGALRQKELSAHDQEQMRLRATTLLDEVGDVQRRGVKLLSYMPVDA